MCTVNQAKLHAKRLEAALKSRGVSITHSESLELVAKQAGIKDWNTFVAKSKMADARAKRRLEEPHGWAFLAEHPTAYDFGIHEGSGLAGNAAIIRLERGAATDVYSTESRAFGCFTQSVSAVPFHGQRLKISADLRSEGVTHGATLWMRVDRMPGQTLAFDNLKDNSHGWLFGDNSLISRHIILDVDPNAISIHYGFFLKGCGAIWAESFSVKRAAINETPTIDKNKIQTFNPSWIAPTNLDFTTPTKKVSA